MRTAVGVIPLVVVMALAGCVGANPIPTLPPSPTMTPVFASEDEALAAAEDAYRAYSEMSDLISSEGGVDPERIEPFVSQGQLSQEMDAFAILRESGLRITGETTLEVAEVQEVDLSGTEAQVAFYVCLDISESRVIDSAGQDATPIGRAARYLLEVVMTTVDGKPPFVLESNQPWPDSGC